MDKWIKTSERLPNHHSTVWIAGEMKYTTKDEMYYFVDVGWLENEQSYEKYRGFHTDIPEDVDRWGSLNDWYEGQKHYKITHWMEIDKPKHPTTGKIE